MESWKEKWVDAKGYEGIYKVSSEGRIWSLYKNRALEPSVCKDGYKRFYACKDGKRKLMAVHRLVAVSFIENLDSGKNEVNHIDGNKINNSVSNLEWVSRSENMLHMYKTLNKGRNGRPIRCIETGIVYRSSIDASKKTGIYASGIRNAVNGVKRKAGGYTWERI